MKKSCWAQNEDQLQVSRERCLPNKFSLLFSVSQLQKIFFNKEKPPLNHKLTLSKASHNGVTNYKLARLVQRASFKQTFTLLWERESILLQSHFSGLACNALTLTLRLCPAKEANKQWWINTFSTAILSQLPYLLFHRGCQEKPPLLSEHLTTHF